MTDNSNAEPELIWPDAADGSPSLPMEPELWAAGCDLDTARFVARQLAKDGYALVRADETISMLKAERAKAYEAAAQVAEKHRAEYHGRAPLNPSAAMIDERMGAAASAIYSELSALAKETERMSDDTEWPREIWMAELDEHHNGRGDVVLSEHATVPRYEGDKERDREFHRYVDGDIFDSQVKYAKHQREVAADELDRLRAENERLRAAIKPFADCVYNDNGDVTIDTSHLKTGAWVVARAALKTDGGKG